MCEEERGQERKECHTKKGELTVIPHPPLASLFADPPRAEGMGMVSQVTFGRRRSSSVFHLCFKSEEGDK